MKKITIKMQKYLHRNIYPLFFLLFPVIKNKIVFSSYGGKQYSDNPRAISEKIIQLNSRCDIVWIVNDPELYKNKIVNNVRYVKSESLRAAYELFTAGVWVDNIRKSLYYKKRKSTLYIQTWHGTPLKKIELDASDKLTKSYVKYAKRDNKNINILLSGNKYSSEILKRVFEYDNELLEVGTPRNDSLINSTTSEILTMKEKFGFGEKFVILYAPTFRNNIFENGKKQLELLNPELIINHIKKEYNVDAVLLTRFHSNVVTSKETMDYIENYKEIIIDYSKYDDIKDLYLVSDLLITDFSSVLFDYSILKRPIVLFVTDEEKYTEERGVYINLSEIPLKVAKNTSELNELLSMKNIEELIESTVLLLNTLGDFESGNASEEVANIILKHMNN